MKKCSFDAILFVVLRQRMGKYTDGQWLANGSQLPQLIHTALPFASMAANDDGQIYPHNKTLRSRSPVSPGLQDKGQMKNHSKHPDQFLKKCPKTLLSSQENDSGCKLNRDSIQAWRSLLAIYTRPQIILIATFMHPQKQTAVSLSNYLVTAS